jgi:hypothetical protein
MMAGPLRRATRVVVGSTLVLLAIFLVLFATDAELPPEAKAFGFLSVFILFPILLVYVLAYPVVRLGRWGLRVARQRQRSTASWTLDNALWTVAVIVAFGVVVSQAPETDQQRAARGAARATRHVRELASAIEKYRQHTGRLPDGLPNLLSAATNVQGRTAGPFIRRVPAAPYDYSAYRYEARPDGTYSISTHRRGGATITAP